jgi:transcriptional regulator with XRE-family HTH domain
MTQIDISGVGTRIAYYRKLNGDSGDALAEKAGNGLTRSVLANIESGRKKDLSLTQLLAIAVALQVPPVALIFDIKKPNQPSGVNLRIGADGRTEFTSAEALAWFGGVEYGFDPEWPPSRLEVREVLGALSAYSRGRSDVEMSLGSGDEARRQLALDASGTSDEPPLTDSAKRALEQFIRLADGTREQQQFVVDRLRALGVEGDFHA